MKQQTLVGFERYGKTTRRAQFLAEMERVVPWSELLAPIEPVYPKVSEAGGRPPVPLERMLRIYFLQAWFNLSDPAVEEALYDSATMRAFAGVDLGQEAAPDETTVCKFRHPLERHKLGKQLLESVNRHLKSQGIKITNGTIVDATIISAPSSTKNKDGERDPEMHQNTEPRLPWWMWIVIVLFFPIGLTGFCSWFLLLPLLYLAIKYVYGKKKEFKADLVTGSWQSNDEKFWTPVRKILGV